MNEDTKHTGSCFCGDVEVEVTGSPVAMGYCHCASCRRWSAGPVNAFSLWKPADVKITRGADNLGSYNKTPTSCRKWCMTCGGHVLTEHPTLGVTDVYVAVLDDLAFEPGVHVNYQETVLPMHDGLTKLKDFPAEMGGSGVQLSE